MHWFCLGKYYLQYIYSIKETGDEDKTISFQFFSDCTVMNKPLEKKESTNVMFIIKQMLAYKTIVVTDNMPDSFHKQSWASRSFRVHIRFPFGTLYL